MSVVARVTLALTLPAVLTCAALGSRPQTLRTPHERAPGLATSATPQERPVANEETISSDDDNNNGAVDLYGNQVTDAVAEYKLDATGTLYELHSPQIELPRLPSPRS